MHNSANLQLFAHSTNFFTVFFSISFIFSPTPQKVYTHLRISKATACRHGHPTEAAACFKLSDALRIFVD